jgi:hypothetical protein
MGEACASPISNMRCYIIGNGKSLTYADLDVIAGKPSIGCNRINLSYPFTKWRPTIYVHPESFAPNLPYIQEHVDMGIPCYLGEHFAEPPRGKLTLKDSPNIHWINDHPCHLLNFDDKELPDEWLLPQLCSFGGSVNLMMQVAVLNGIDEMILLGCDLMYKDKKPSHFTPAYEHGGEQPSFYASRNAFYGHVQALNWIRRKGQHVQVYNATRGGLLELWERVHLSDVL